MERTTAVRLKDLLEHRARIVKDMRALTEAPAGDGGDLSTEQSTKFDALKGELTGLETRIERQQLLDEAERRMAGEPLAGTGDDRLDDAMQEFSLRRAICAGIPDLATVVDSSRERELSTELARRTGMSAKGFLVPVSVFRKRLEKRVLTAGGAAGELVGTDHRGDLYIDLLRSALVTRRLGATVLNDLRGNVEIPRLDASAGFAWVAENAAITPSDPDVGEATLTPKHAGAITEYSRNLLLQSSPDIEQLLRADFAATLARGVDKAALRGGGSNEPVGIMASASAVKKVSMSGGITWAGILEIIATVEGGNALGTSPGWAVNPWVVKMGRQTVKATTKVAQDTGSPGDEVLVDVNDAGAGFVIDMPNAIAGYPAIASTLLAGSPADTTPSPDIPAVDGEVVFGNWSDLVIGYWSVLDILVNPYAATPYSKGNVQIRGMLTTDVELRHAASFCFSEDIPIS